MHPTEPDHPPEAALLTLLHHQPLPARTELQSHLRFCEACRARMLYLSCRELEIGELLAELDHSVPAHDLDAILGPARWTGTASRDAGRQHRVGHCRGRSRRDTAGVSGPALGPGPPRRGPKHRTSRRL